jgi:TonB-dependent SusC/RagA subfamily outer membrane receptor
VIENRALGYRVKYLLTDFILSNSDDGSGYFFYSGSVLFEQLQGSPAEQEQWSKRRNEIYNNSLAHFLRSAMRNHLDADGFKVYRFLVDHTRPSDSLVNAKLKYFNLIKGQGSYRDSLAFWKKVQKSPKLLANQTAVALTGEDVVAKTKSPGVYRFGCEKDALYVLRGRRPEKTSVLLNHLQDPNNSSETLITFDQPEAYFDRNGAILNPGCMTFMGAWAKNGIADLLPVNFEPEGKQKDLEVDSVVLTKVEKSLNGLELSRRLEKTYLHFDKPYYAAGDTIYFKAYVTDPLNQLSSLSKILHVDFIGPIGTIEQSIQLRLNDGLAAGDLALPETIGGGYYRVRAYTNLMRNYDQDFFFDKHIYIANSVVSSVPAGRLPKKTDNAERTISNTMSKSKIDVQFFPEGGNLISGVPCRIGFKATASDGLGVEVKGTVYNKEGKPVTSFISKHLGMGSFMLIPAAGENYNVSIEGINNKISADLPSVNDAGFLLSTDDTSPRDIRITIIPGVLNHQVRVNVVGQSGGTIYSFNTCKVEPKGFTISLPKDQFPEGITQFTLFSAEGEPLNERLVFIRSGKELDLNLAVAQKHSFPRSKVNITLTAKDNFNQPIAGNFSVAVVDQTKVPVNDDDEISICTSLLLTSELKGNIEKPNYYFSRDNREAAHDLDLLMLTQGYRAFEWHPIIKYQYPPLNFQPEKKLSISGKITSTGGKPLAHEKVSLTSVSNIFFNADTTSDEKGNFIFDRLPDIDSMRYIVQASDKISRKNSAVVLFNQPVKTNQGGSPSQYPTIADTSSKSFLAHSLDFHQQQINQGFGRHSQLLRQVEIKAVRQSDKLKNSANLNGGGNANDVIMGDQLSIGCAVLTDCLAGRLHGIRFVGGTPYYGGLNGHLETAVFVDGVELIGRIVLYYDANHNPVYSGGPTKEELINQLSVNDIASIEIITDAGLAAIYGARGAGGAIIITTKRFSDVVGKTTFKQAFAYYYAPGFYKARVFYSPKYNTREHSDGSKDLRTTIYWNPNLKTGQDGMASFDFFNADTKGVYRIVVEGIDEQGRVGRIVYRYSIE